MDTSNATPVPPAYDLPSQGSLARHSFARLARGIEATRQTGRLYLLSGSTKKVVFFQAGRPVFVRSNILTECLGRVLAAEGLITTEQCDQTLEAIRRTGKKQGELLVEMGILSAGNLRYGLTAQLRTKLYDIFSWEEGRFRFQPGAHDHGFETSNLESVSSLILAAIAERVPEKRARERLAARGDEYPRLLDAARPDELGLLPEEVVCLSALDGSTRLRDLLERPPEAPIPSAPLLYLGASEAGLLHWSREPEVVERRVKLKAVPAADPRSDAELAPTYEATHVLTDYEDTPLPGALPRPPSPLGADEDAAFDGVTDGDDPPSGRFPIVRDEAPLPAAEPDLAGFSDDMDLSDDAELARLAGALLVDDDLNLDDDEVGAVPESRPDPLTKDAVPSLVAPSGGSHTPTGTERRTDAELLDLDELDNVDLGPTELGGSTEPVAPAKDPGTTNPELLGAMYFSEAEQSLAAGDFATAVSLLEQAYDQGFDVAELHAMLAYARFMSSEPTPDAAEHPLALLEYAEGIDPSLDLVHAYRAAILRAIGQPADARASLQRALELNPYNDVAVALFQELGGPSHKRR